MANIRALLDKNVSHWDAMMRQGKASEVHRQMLRLKFSQIPSSYRRRVAHLFRRIGDFSSALKAIAPSILTPDFNYLPGVNAEDMAEYGIILQKLGRTDEALDLLKSMGERSTPRRGLYMAFCFFAKFDYHSSIPFLENYIRSSELTPYEKLIGQVNLLSAYVEIDDAAKALAMAETCIRSCDEGGHTRLRGNCKELKGRVFLIRNELEKAEVILCEAAKDLSSDSNRYLFIVQLYQSYIKDRRNGNIENLLQFRDVLRENKKYELVRELDFLCLTLRPTQELFNKLYLGTRYPGFRQKMEEKFPENFEKLPAKWIFGDSSKVLCVEEGIFNGEQILAKGRKTHQLLCAAFSDLYHPPRLTYLHSKIFPEEIFDVYHSVNKVKQLIFRLNGELKKKGVPLNFHVEEGRLVRSQDSPIKLEFKSNSELMEPEHYHLRALEDAFAGEEFSRKQAEQILGLSKAQTKRILALLAETGLLYRQRKGKVFYYSMTNPQSLAA